MVKNDNFQLVLSTKWSLLRNHFAATKVQYDIVYKCIYKFPTVLTTILVLIVK